MSVCPNVFQFSVTLMAQYVMEVKEIKVIFVPASTNTAVPPLTSQVNTLPAKFRSGSKYQR